MRTVFLESLVNLMRKNKDIITITADMGYSVFEEVQKEFPTRFFNTGVTEQSSIGIATGLALSGHTVFFYAQAPFATMRCFEQIRLDVAYNRADVKIVGAAAGFSSNQLGVSHFSLEDLALMRLLPGMTIYNPGDPYEAGWVTKTAYEKKGPAYIRITKAVSPAVHSSGLFKNPEKGILIKRGGMFTFFVSGSLLPLAAEIVESLADKGFTGSLISVPVLKPFNENLILNASRKSRNIFTLEEHSILGGLGTIVAEIIAESKIDALLKRFGSPDEFTSITGSVPYLLEHNNLSKNYIENQMLSFLKNSSVNPSGSK